MRHLILTNHQCPGDILMLTAAVRDLHRANPGEFLTDVRTSAAELWAHNPFLTPLDEYAPGVERIEMHYPAIHQSNQRPYHFIHGFAQYLEAQLGLRIPITEFRGDIHLAPEELAAPSPLEAYGHAGRYWIIVAGGKADFTAKWWDPARYQAVVDHFQGAIQFVQCGAAGDWHPELRGVIDLVGQTSLREFVHVMHHADGVVCPVTFAMHLAAAIPPRAGTSSRHCVVVAGGREPPHWEAYPQHQFLHTIGAFDCCATGGCWKLRCQRLGDGDVNDDFNRCERPVRVSPTLEIPACLDAITAEDVIRAIERYVADIESSRPPAMARRPLPLAGASS